MPRATIDDVAREAGVSAATVSRALRGLPNVAPATRAHIRSIAASLDYEPHAQASRLASGRTMTVGLVAPLFGLWHASQVVAGAESALSERGYDLLIHAVDTPDNRRRFLERVGSFSGRVDGLVFVDFFATEQQADQLRALNVRAATIGERINGFSSITIDNVAAAATGTEHLLELGHRRIGLMSGPAKHGLRTPVPQQRRNGFEHAMAAYGLRHDPTLQVDGGFTTDGGADAMRRLLDLAEPPTAVFCMSDEMAMGAIGAARDRGIRIPEDISVIGFDGHDLTGAFGLTTMHQPVREMGRIATTRLLDTIASNDAGDTHDTAPVSLMVRSSTAPPTEV